MRWIDTYHWRDLAPSKRPFDPSTVRSIVRDNAVRPVVGDKAWSSIDHSDLIAAIERALLAEYGIWVGGWDWSPDSNDNGGPVQAWGLQTGQRTGNEDAFIDLVVEAVLEWRSVLEELESSFSELLASPLSSPAAQVERAAVRLLPIVTRRTATDGMWYHTLIAVLVWYLEASGLERSITKGIIDEAVSGRFHSWTAPETSPEFCADLGARIADEAMDPNNARAKRRSEIATREDALVAWTRIRSVAFVGFPPPDADDDYRVPPRGPLRYDGHQRFIDGPERARDPKRADAMHVALDACRASAERDEPLTFELLAAWQSIVLGYSGDEKSVAFRTTDAYAKGGRERYGIAPDTRARFDAALADANDRSSPRLSVAARAARVYLDVCFFHPFADGNARAARLALDHTLLREGFVLHAAEPIFVVSRSATDANGARLFAALVNQLIGANR